MNEIFVVSDYYGTNVCAYATFTAAKKYILEEILGHLFDFEYEFESEQDTSREEFYTDEEYENALKNYLTKRIMEDGIFYDEFLINRVPFMNE